MAIGTSARSGEKERAGLDQRGLRPRCCSSRPGLLGILRGSHGGENRVGRRHRDRRDGDRGARAVRRVGGVGRARSSASLVVISPWVLGFAAVHTALWTCVVLGIIVALASISEIWVVHHPAITAK